MTDQTAIVSSDAENLRNKKRLAKRFASERRFKMFGLGAVLLTVTFLVILMSAILTKGLPAFTHHYGALNIDLASHVKPENLAKGKYSKAFKNSIKTQFPFAKTRKAKKNTRQIFSSAAAIDLKRQVIVQPEFVTQKTSEKIWLPMGDFADLYLKGSIAEGALESQNAGLSLVKNDDSYTLTIGENGSFENLLSKTKSSLSNKLAALGRKITRKTLESETRKDLVDANKNDANQATLEAQFNESQTELQKLMKRHSELNSRLADQQSGEQLDSSTPSILIYLDQAILKAQTISPSQIQAEILVPFAGAAPQTITQWQAQFVSTPQNARKFSDFEVALVETLRAQGSIERRWNEPFFANAASREPEVAGIRGALVGSILTMAVTLILAFPLGVMAAIYLEEFAPKNRLTDLVEVNINNLAAVPSIIFGLLGLAILLNWFNMPRSAPIAGGVVLALMTLPTIIIASRAAMRAVPPSIREAALGVGASKIQSVFHHVLPVAMPGIFTGTIIGMAQALGETAPLLMIGMVAFIADVSTSFSDPATVLPVQIYMWADFPEPAFQQKTAAAILVLLALLVAINAVAVFLRRRFERRW